MREQLALDAYVAARDVRIGLRVRAGEVVALVGDGSYQMAPQEIATLVAEGVKVVIVVLQNHGWASIGALSESRGSQRFATAYRRRDPATGLLEGDPVPLDIAANLRPSSVIVRNACLTSSRHMATASRMASTISTTGHR